MRVQNRADDKRHNNGDEDGDSGSRTSSIRHNGRTKYPVVEMEKMNKVIQFVSCGKKRG